MERKDKREKRTRKQKEAEMPIKNALVLPNKVNIKKFDHPAKMLPGTPPPRQLADTAAADMTDADQNFLSKQQRRYFRKNHQDKIRSTMAKLQKEQQKSDRSKYRKTNAMNIRLVLVKKTKTTYYNLQSLLP